MAKYKLQELTDMRNEGKRRVYPKIVTNRTLSRKEFIKRMQSYHRGISESTTEAVLLDVADMLVEMLSMGYNVNIEGIGTFSLSLGFEDDKPTEMQSEDDKMTYRKVGVKDINFKASPEFLKSVKHKTDRDLERDMGGVKVIRKQLYSREERIARALEVIETNGLITLSEYACINNLSRTAASLELKEITADRTSPIDSKGSGSHKVWVKRKENVFLYYLKSATKPFNVLLACTCPLITELADKLRLKTPIFVKNQLTRNNFRKIMVYLQCCSKQAAVICY